MGYLDPMGTFARVAEPHAKHRVELERLAEEQAALRRVATLVAGGAPSSEVFEAVAKEVAQVLHLRNAWVCRYEDDGAVIKMLAVVGSRPDTFHPGSRWPLDGPSVAREILRTGRAQRVEVDADLPGTLAAEARKGGFNRVAGAPIIVDGRVWGVIATSSPDAPLPNDLEERLAEFTDLVATAIANSQAHEELTRLAEEQAALRRVATLVAAGAPAAEVFEAVSAEVAALIAADGSALTRYESDGTVTAVSGWTTAGGYKYVGRRYPLDGTVSGLIFDTGRPGRVENYAEAPGEAPEAAREMGWRSSVGVPITVDGRLWGVLAVSSKGEKQLPPRPSSDWPSSRSSSRPRSQTARHTSSSRSSPTNRRLYDGWPRLSPKARLLTVCSTASDMRWHGCSTPPSACCSATTPTAPRPCLPLPTATWAPSGTAGPSKVTAARSRGSAEPASRRAPTTPDSRKDRSRLLREP